MDNEKLPTLMDRLMPNIEGQQIIKDSLVEFVETFEPSDSHALWYKLMKEEAYEWMEEFLLEGFTDNLIKEYCDILYVVQGFENLGEVKEKVKADEAQLEGLIQLLLLASNITLTFMTTLEIIEGFKRVHASNLSKLTEEGKVLRREDGKIIKSDLYREPDMSGILKPQRILNYAKEGIGL